MDKITLGASALFRFDKSGPADLLSEGRAQLDDLARRLGAAYVSIEGIALVGHTDRLGNAGYNARLSLQRAETVKAYLAARGLSVPITASGQGAAQPVTDCKATLAHAALTTCLQPNRRVDIEVRGVRR